MPKITHFFKKISNLSFTVSIINIIINNISE